MKKLLFFFVLLLQFVTHQSRACYATISPGSMTTVCVGNTTVLTANTGTSYQWYVNGNLITGATNQTYAAGGGNYTVTVYDAPTSCSATSAATNVMVSAPNAYINPPTTTVICGSGSIQLCGQCCQGSYQWMLNGVNITGANNYCYTATTPGSYTLYVNTGLCTATSPTPVVITGSSGPSATITATPSATICAGSTTTLCAPAGTSNTYQWQLNNTSISGATSMCYTTGVAGSYSVIVYNGGCSATSVPIVVTVNPLPNATINVTPSAAICLGDTAHLCVAGGTGYTYQWTINSATYPPNSNTCLLLWTPSNASVTITSPQGCVSTSSLVTTSYLPTTIPPTASSNSPVALGQNIMLTATSNYTNGTYQWTGPNGFTSTQQNPQISSATSAMGGNYWVSVYNGVCNSTYAPVIVVVSEPVWPGDANYDLTADNTDILVLGVTYGNTGPVRAGATNNWVGQPCTNWSGFLPWSLTNMKHADCDGDGVVGASDTLAVSLNYGQTHPKEEPHHPSQKVTGLPDLYFDTQGVSFTPGTTVTIPIKLGSTATGFNQFYGVAAQIKISGLTLTAPMQVTYTNSWIGNAGNTLRFTKNVTNDRLDWAYVRNDHQNIDGSGTIGELVFTIPANAPSSQVLLHFDNVKIIDKNAVVYTNYYNVLDDTSYVSATGVAQTNGLINAAAIVPNPSHGNAVIQLTLAAATDMQVTITDASGKTVWNKTVNGIAGKQNIELPAANIASGVYQVALKTKDGKAVQMLKWMNEAK